MRPSKLRNLSCWMLLAVTPACLLAADSGAAMLYAKGTAWINGSSVPRSSAVFPGDLVRLGRTLWSTSMRRVRA
jgi:hypothetical protein